MDQGGAKPEIVVAAEKGLGGAIVLAPYKRGARKCSPYWMVTLPSDRRVQRSIDAPLSWALDELWQGVPVNILEMGPGKQPEARCYI